MSTHCTDEQLTWLQYGELAPEEQQFITEHLAGCEACREELDALQQTFSRIDDLDVPEPGESYGREVWRRLEPQLPALSGVEGPALSGAVRPETRVHRWLKAVLPFSVVSGLPPSLGFGETRRSAERGGGSRTLDAEAVRRRPRLAFAAAVAALLLGAFLAGRYSQFTSESPARPRSAGYDEAGDTAGPSAGVRERILLVAVGDHLDRSQMVLTELTHAGGAGPLDISVEQEWADELVVSNRLYRQTAAQVGEGALESILDELEPVLLDIAQGPTVLSVEQLSEIQERIEAQGILFKVRVIGSRVREREELR